jgi:hypothetical protein
MTNENELLQKLMISKKMMDIHNKIPRSNQTSEVNYNIPEVEKFDTPSASYNIPQEFMMEQQSKPIHNSEAPALDRIMSSKLPDEIKQLMIEYPIAQPNGTSGPTLSNELVEKASRLMNTNSKGSMINETPTQKQSNILSSLTAKQIENIVRETVEKVLSENGLLTESTQKSNETFQFRVGKHIFEGKVMKIKKVQ